jgi:hypothetical protein
MIHKGLYDYRDLFHNHTAFRDSKAVIGLQVADICANICYRFHRSDRKDLGAYTLLWRRIMCEGKAEIHVITVDERSLHKGDLSELVWNIGRRRIQTASRHKRAGLRHGLKQRSRHFHNETTMNDFVTSDIVTDTEAQFALAALLTCEYFKGYRDGYYEAREAGCLNRYRNYITLLEDLSDIHGYNEQHAKAYAKRFRDASRDWRNCEAIFSEVIVYRAYIRNVYEGLIRAIHLEEAESDIIVERLDGSRMFLEVFCVMPNFPLPKDGGFSLYDVKTHTQTSLASIRQKLLRKISKQNQLSKPRENFAVIELNDVSIAGDFAVLSSLSGGYKLNVDIHNHRVVSSGYDWSNSIFNDPSTQFLKGIIYFSLGDYESRKFLFNPKFGAKETLAQ